jgi:citrate lyase subunit beta/citryl-CoA lyase
MRSLLFVPGDSERKLDKALGSAADALIVDLEDSVAASAKPAARGRAAAFLASPGAGTAGKALYVRINDLKSGLADADLAAVMPAAPGGIVLPKACGIADIVQLAARLRVAEAENGLPDGATRIVAIATETPAAVLALPGFQGSVPRLAGLTWGAEDLSAAVGARTARDESGRYTDLFRLARALTLAAAAAVDTAPIDTVFVDFRDRQGLLAECAAAERDGFTGKLAIHPDQAEIINAAFTPSDAAVAEAAAVVAAFRDAGDAGVVAIEGRMYDRPHLGRAERVLARAAAKRI